MIFLIWTNISFGFDNNPGYKKNLVKKYRQQRDQIEVFTTKYPDSALVIAREMMRKAKSSNNDELKALSYSALGFVQISLTNLDLAERLLKKAISINKNQKKYRELAINYNYLGLVYQRRSNFVAASNFFFESLDLAEKQKNYNLMQRNYNGISMVFCDQDDFEKALKYAKKSNDMVKYNKDNLRHSHSISILAEVYREMGNLELAEIYFSKSYKSYRKLNDEFGQAWCLTNWSLIYDTAQILKAVDMELEAQRIWDKSFPENVMSMTNLGNLGWSLFTVAKDSKLINSIGNTALPKTKNELLKESERYYKKCLEIAKRKNNLNTLLFYSGSLSELQAYKGDMKSAYENVLLNKNLSDSLFSQENKNKIATFESEKALEAKQNALEINELKLKASENQKWFFVGGVILLGVIGMLLYYQSRIRRKNNLILERANFELEQANAAKAKLFGIINHDLRGPIASLINFLNLQQMQPELLDKTTQDRLMAKTLYSTEQLLLTMEDLLQWSKGQMEQFKPDMQDVSVAGIFEETGAFFSGLKIDLRFEVAENSRLQTDPNYLKTILRNLTANAIKAISSVEDPTVVWKYYKQQGIKCLSILDNGPGMSKDQLKVLFDNSETAGINKGLGLHIVRDMAKAIECTIEWNEDYKNGTEFILKFEKN